MTPVLFWSFNNVKKVIGKVCSGKGDFAQWIAKLNDHYKRKTGMAFFPGTLNVRLDAPYHIPPNSMRLEGTEYGGTVNVNLVPCTVFGRRAFILRTDKEEAGLGSHPLEVIEIATDIKLRDTYGLQDGSVVELELESIAEPGDCNERHSNATVSDSIPSVRKPPRCNTQ